MHTIPPSSCLLIALITVSVAAGEAPGLYLHAAFDAAADAQGPGVAHAATEGRVSFVSGRVGQAAEFRASARVRLSLARPFPRSAGSVALWVRPDFGSSDSAGHVLFLVPTQSGESHDNVQMQLLSHGRLLLRVGKMGGAEVTVSNLHYAPGQWIHLAMAWDPRGLVVYVDGKRAAAHCRPEPVPTLAATMHIGGWPDGSRPADAALDDLRVYDRKLTDAEVAALAGGATGQALGPRPMPGAPRPAGPEVRPLPNQPDLLLHLSFDQWPVPWARPLKPGRGRTVGSRVPGRFGQAVEFTGPGAKVNVGRHFPTQRGTVTFWVRPKWPGSQSESRVFFHVPTDSRRVMDNYHVQTYGGNLSVRVGALTDDKVKGAGLNSRVQREWQPGEWHFLALRWSPQRVELFVDGRWVHRHSPAAYPFKPRSSLIIGSWSDGRRSAAAALDEFRVFTRDIPDEEIRSLWQQNRWPLKQP